jgi:hypothetical protein
MNQITFSWWPWKVLALTVPVVAAGAGIFVASQRNYDESQLVIITLGVLSAGNAYILALANGRLSRLVLAVPLGAVTGFLPMLLAFSRYVYVPFLVLLGVWSVVFVIGGCLRGWVSGEGSWFMTIKTELGYFVFMPLLICWLYFVGEMVVHQTYRQDLFGMAILSFPCVNGILAVCINARGEVIDVILAFASALAPSLRGMLAGCVVFFGLYFVFGVSGLRGFGVISFTGAGIAANYYFIANYLPFVNRDVPKQLPSETRQNSNEVL